MDLTEIIVPSWILDKSLTQRGSCACFILMHSLKLLMDKMQVLGTSAEHLHNGEREREGGKSHTHTRKKKRKEGYSQ